MRSRQRQPMDSLTTFLDFRCQIQPSGLSEKAGAPELHFCQTPIDGSRGLHGRGFSACGLNLTGLFSCGFFPFILVCPPPSPLNFKKIQLDLPAWEGRVS